MMALALETPIAVSSLPDLDAAYTVTSERAQACRRDGYVLPHDFDPALIDRVGLLFVIWEHNPVAFRQPLPALLATCDRHGIKVLPALFDDCSFGPINDPM